MDIGIVVRIVLWALLESLSRSMSSWLAENVNGRSSYRQQATTSLGCYKKGVLLINGRSKVVMMEAWSLILLWCRLWNPKVDLLFELPRAPRTEAVAQNRAGQIQIKAGQLVGWRNDEISNGACYVGSLRGVSKSVQVVSN